MQNLPVVAVNLLHRVGRWCRLAFGALAAVTQTFAAAIMIDNDVGTNAVTVQTATFDIDADGAINAAGVSAVNAHSGVALP